MINISEEFKKSNYSFNRSLSSDISLPYTYQDIEIGVNELSNYYNLNTSLEKLQSNLLYLYSVSKFSNPDLPISYRGWIGTNLNLSKKLYVQIRNLQLNTAVKFENDNIFGKVFDFTIPYFSILDSNNNTYNFIYSWNGTVNPETLLLPSGKKIEIELTTWGVDRNINNTQAALQTETELKNIGFNTVLTQSNNIILEIISPTYGGIFNNNKDPLTYQYLLGDSCNVIVEQALPKYEFKIQSGRNNSSKVNKSNFDSLNSVTVKPGSIKNFECLFTCSDTRIQALSVDDSSNNVNDYQFISYTDTYGQNNKLNFLKINAIANYENFIYVSDELRNNIVKININGFIKNDEHRYNKFYETEIIGGQGNVRNNYSFNSPKILQFYKNNLYVLDKGNNTIKIFDKDLSFIKNIRKSKFISDNPPVAIKIYNDNYYYLSNDKLYVFDLDFNLLNTVTLVKLLNLETFLDLKISQKNNNLYIISQLNVYKYYADSLDYIGNFDFEKINVNPNVLKFIEIYETDDNKDLIYIYLNKNGVGSFLVFDEDSGFINLLSDYNFSIYSLDEIKYKKEEYNSNFSYNKSIIKLISNTLQLRNFLYRKVNIKLKRNGSYIYNGITYFNPEDIDITNYRTNLNNYIGTNEIYSRSVINRILNEIYNLQNSLLSIFRPTITLPDKKSNVLTPDYEGLMLETFPAMQRDYFVLEESTDLRDYILLE